MTTEYKSASTNIRGYHVDFELDDDNGYPVSQCWVTLRFANRPGKEWCSSLAVIENEGIIESCDGDDYRDVPERVAAEIAAWAYKQGY